MGNLGVWAILPVLAAAATGADEGATLREEATRGQARRVTATMEAEGTRPGFGADKKPLPFEVRTRFEYAERVLEVGRDGLATRVVRRAEAAEATIGAFRGEGQSLAAKLRPEVALLVAERADGAVRTVSAGGPLVRAELDLVQGAADSLLLAEVLPVGPVKPGDSWKVPDAAARALTEYDALASNDLKATLATLTDAEATIALKGKVLGAVRGGEGSMTLDGRLVFDRGAKLVRGLELSRVESRKAGPVESALEAKSRIAVERGAIDTPAELADAAIGGLPLDDASGPRDLLVLTPPGGEYTLLHDRDWHLAMDSARRVVLRRLDHGEVVAQCDLMLGPNAGKGRHQSLEQFRDDVKAALGQSFGSFEGAGEVGGAPEGGFRYKLAVEGRAQEDGGHPLWYYYLAASDAGDQLVAIFSLTKELAGRFGDQDLRLMGTLEWKAR
jgi:hypothetical protein